MKPAWRLMIRRCNDVNFPDYSRYGARGIKICDRWLDFNNYLEDMGDRPLGYEIDRIDNNDDYKLDNCRWSTKKEQANNRRSNHKITYKGLIMNLKQWAEFVGIKRSTLDMRIRHYNWTIEKALTHDARRII